MTSLVLKIQDQLNRLHRREEAQDGFEYLLIVGWGSLLLIVIGAVVLTVIPWRRSPDDFAPWPPRAQLPTTTEASTR